MAVTFDAHFEKGRITGASPFNFVSDAGTVAGSVGSNSNRVLIGVACFFTTLANVGTVSMTWDGVSMPQIGVGLDVAGIISVFLFGRIAPNTGAKTIQVSWTGSEATNPQILGAVSVYNADQATGWNNNITNTGTSTAMTVTVTTTNGDMAIAGAADNNSAGSAPINHGTQDWQDRAFNGNYYGGRNPAVGASTQIDWTLGTSVQWGIAGVNVLQAAVAAGVPFMTTVDAKRI